MCCHNTARALNLLKRALFQTFNEDLSLQATLARYVPGYGVRNNVLSVNSVSHIYVCAHTYINVHIYMYIYVCIYIYMYISIYIHVYVYVCIHMKLFAVCKQSVYHMSPQSAEMSSL